MDSPAKKFAKLTKARVSKFLGFSYHSLDLLKAACYMNQRFNETERWWRRGRKTSEPGTDEETTALQKLIEEHGMAWESLKAIDEENQKILERRDTSALRVKARNMNFAFLD